MAVSYPARVRAAWSIAVLAACSGPSPAPDAARDASLDARRLDARAIDADWRERDGGVSCVPSVFEGDAISITSGGRERSAQIHFPPGAGESGRRYPAIFLIHGGHPLTAETDAPTAMRAAAHMDAVADQMGFIVVYPAGHIGSTGQGWNIGAGCCGDPAAMGIDDVAFLGELADHLVDVACVDRARLYAAGFSQGGFLSHRLACEASDRFAAIAPAAGTNLIEDCAPERPVPVMQIAGTDDNAVRYDGEGGLIEEADSMPDTVMAWAVRNRCEGEPVPVYEMGTARCEAWQDCAEGADVVLCTVEGLGHRWAGGTGEVGDGAFSSDLDASRAIATFVLPFRIP
jgi:polyhydroxybutyrate depolymerase